MFAIFATLSCIEFKQMGVGLAAAILLDATIVRAVLLPATMKLLGDRNWYLPALAAVAAADVVGGSAQRGGVRHDREAVARQQRRGHVARRRAERARERRRLPRAGDEQQPLTGAVQRRARQRDAVGRGLRAVMHRSHSPGRVEHRVVREQRGGVAVLADARAATTSSTTSASSRS